MAKLVLRYMISRGYAERCRLLMEYLGLDYKFEPILDKPTWLKKDKFELMEKYPLINLPYLVDGQTIIAETWAIMMYIALKADRENMLGKTGQEKVEHAAIVGFYNDLDNFYINWAHQKSQDFQRSKAEFKKDLDNRLAKLEAVVTDRQWIVGQTFTLADIMIYDFFSIYQELLWKGELKAFKSLSEYYFRIGEIEAIKKYRSSQRFRKEPCNAPYAQFSPRPY